MRFQCTCISASWTAGLFPFADYNQPGVDKTCSDSLLYVQLQGKKVTLIFLPRLPYHASPPECNPCSSLDRSCTQTSFAPLCSFFEAERQTRAAAVCPFVNKRSTARIDLALLVTSLVQSQQTNTKLLSSSSPCSFATGRRYQNGVRKGATEGRQLVQEDAHLQSKILPEGHARQA